MEKYGYIRVSSKDQNIDRQLIALSYYEIPRNHLYIDKQSGKDFDRPAYQRMLKRLKWGDKLYIEELDRLGRNYDEIIEQWRLITKEKGADIVVLDMPVLDTGSYKDLIGNLICDLVLQILSFVAQSEREKIRRRQAEGIAAAKARGVKFGRPAKHLPDNFDKLYTAWRKKEMTSDELAKRCNMALGVPQNPRTQQSARGTGGAEHRRRSGATRAPLPHILRAINALFSRGSCTGPPPPAPAPRQRA